MASTPDLLVVAAEPPDPARTASLLPLVRAIHLGTRARVSTVWLRDGAAADLWTSAAGDRVVVDDLRTWAPAVAAERTLGRLPAAKLRGAALRARLRRLRQPAVALLVDGVGLDVVDRLPGSPRIVVWRSDPSHSDPSHSDPARVDLVLGAGGTPLPVAHDGISARVAGLDTRRAEWRESHGTSAAPYVVACGAPTSAARFDRLRTELGEQAPTATLDWLPVDSAPSAATPDDTARVAAADALVVVDDDTVRSPLAIAARFAGTPVLVTDEITEPVEPDDEVVDAASIGERVVASSTEPSARRDDRIRAAYLRSDSEARAADFLRLLLDGPTSGVGR